MSRPYKPTIPQTVGETVDLLGWMILRAPTFTDLAFDEMFPGRTPDVVFFELSEGLATVRRELGHSRYHDANEMAGRIRSLLEADPADNNGRAREGRLVMRQLQDLLQAR